MVRPSFVAGFVAADGHFSASGTRFALRVALGARDLETVRAFHQSVGVGDVLILPPRKSTHEGEARWQVQALPDLAQTIVPLCDRFLLPCHKRDQYEIWRAALFGHLNSSHRSWFHGPRICSITGCEAVVRAKLLCRRHYYSETRK